MLRERARLLLLFTLWTATSLVAAEAKRAGGAGTRPRLVVLLIVDQFRADYLERFRDDFVPGGFQRLLTRGAVFANTHYDYATTETAPGHATLATGANPAYHGIVANEWYDRTRKGETTSVEDPGCKLVGVGSSAGASPRKMLGTSLADELRLATGGQARVVALAIKDRSAIWMAGKNPTAAFWWDQDSGRGVSSTYYLPQLPAWVEDFNRKHGLARLVGRPWRALGAPATAPPLATLSILVLPPESQETAVEPRGSPFANEAVLELARRAVLEYKLGRGRATDFLAVGLSSNDYLGHFAGPDSPLVRDMTLRTDRMLAHFLRFLDTQVGPGNFLLAFSADHGVAPLPEVLGENRIEAGRVREQDAAQAMEDALRAAYGGAAEEKWVDWTDLPNVYLNHALLEKYKVNRAEAARRAGEAALQIPGILTYFTADQLVAGPQTDMVARRVANSFFRGRSGDLILVWKPLYHKALDSGRGTNHNSPWNYDTHVPLIFLGPGFRPGLYHSAATPADLAPTLAAVLGINPPSVATGRVLAEALPARVLPTHGPRR